MKEFIYKEDYKKFKPNDKVKITFINKDKEEVTDCCRIVSIDNKKISFEVGKTVHECTASKVKNIKKCRRSIIVIIVVAGAVLLYSLLHMLSINIRYNKCMADEIAECQYMTDYGFGSEYDNAKRNYEENCRMRYCLARLFKKK